MKKAISLILVMLTVISLSFTTIYAAPSPSSIGAVSTSGAVATITSADNAEVTETAVITKTDTTMSIKQLQTDTDIVYRSENSRKIVNNQNAVVLSALDISIPGGIKNGATASVMVRAAGVNKDTKLVVLHYVNGVWQEENNTCGDGTVTIMNLTSCSPFLFIADKSTLVSTVTATNGNRVKSDKTGEGIGLPLAVSLAVVSAGGIWIRRRRQEY